MYIYMYVYIYICIFQFADTSCGICRSLSATSASTSQVKRRLRVAKAKLSTLQAGPVGEKSHDKATKNWGIKTWGFSWGKIIVGVYITGILPIYAVYYIVILYKIYQSNGGNITSCVFYWTSSHGATSLQ